MCFINQNLSPGVAPPHLLRSEMPRLFFSFCSMPFLIMSHKPSEVETEHLKLTTATAKPKIGHFEIAEKTFCLFFLSSSMSSSSMSSSLSSSLSSSSTTNYHLFKKTLEAIGCGFRCFDLSNVIQISAAAASLCSIDCKGLTNC